MKRLMNRILSALFACAAAGATAETYTWTPGVSGLWSDSLKWTPNGVPANGDTVAFGGDSTADTVVEIGNAPTVSVPKATSISGGDALVLKGADGNGSLAVVNNGVEIQIAGGPLVVRDLDMSVKVTNNGSNNRMFLTGGGSSTNTILALEGDSVLSVVDTMMLLSGDNNAKGSRVAVHDNASLVLSGISSYLQLGRGKNTWGGLEQRGGSVTCGGEVSLGYNNGGAFGSWEMFSGTSVVSTNIKLAVGSGSNAGLYIHGGKLTLGRYSQFGCAGRSEVFIDGGEMSFPNKTMSLVDRGSDTEDYPSVLTLAGDAKVSGFNILPYGDRSGYEGMSRAMVNLNGGSLLSLTDAFNVKAAVSSSRATLSFNGGTLERVTGSPDSEANKNLLKGIDAVVYSGGGRLRARKSDGSSSGMTLNSARFRKADGWGVASITVTDGGSGYLLPPLVDITGGSGSNATAVAQIDYEKQQVTNVIVTCSGEGYDPDDMLAVSFVVPSSPNVAPAKATATLSENIPGTLRIAAGSVVVFGADFQYDGDFAAEEKAYVRISGNVGFGGASAFNSLEIVDGGKVAFAGSATAANVDLKSAGTLAIAVGGSLSVANGAALNGAIEVARASAMPLVAVGGNCVFGEDAKIIPSAGLPVGTPIPVVKVSGTVSGAPQLYGEESVKWKLSAKSENGVTTYSLVSRRGLVMVLK